MEPIVLMTVRQYADKMCRNRDRSYLSRVGRRASQLAEEAEAPKGVLVRGKFRTPSYPESVLRQAFSDVRP